jgi:hypothetical protein
LGQSEPHSFYYPLNVGDFWEYLYRSAFQETWEVIGDTMMSNGKLYHIVKQQATGNTAFKFQRISDENELLQFHPFKNTESLIFKLNIKVGDTWNFSLSALDSGFFKVTDLADTTLWERKLKYAVIQDFTLPDSTRPLAPNDIYIADSIGIFYHGFEGGFIKLKGAIINGKKFGSLTTVEAEKPASPQSVFIKQNYPNPFNAETRIDFVIPEPGLVAISVYNIAGQEIRKLLGDELSPGSYSINWDGKDNDSKLVGTGVYIYMLQHITNHQTFSLARKLLMLR